MLVLKRCSNESLKLKTSDGDIKLHFLRTGQQVVIGIDAPNQVTILRSELQGSTNKAFESDCRT